MKEKGVDRKGLVSLGRILQYDEESGKYFLVFHTRFEKERRNASGKGTSDVFNEDGRWYCHIVTVVRHRKNIVKQI